MKAQDYGFKLSNNEARSGDKRLKIDEDEELFLDQFKDKKYKTKDYGFKLSDSDGTREKGKRRKGGENSQ
jgi:hypothetical protein